MAGLSDLKARNIKPGERLPDGTVDGLHLICDSTPGRGRWELRFTSPTTAKRRYKGLGPYPEIGVAAARKAGNEARELIAKGVDPIDAPPPRTAAEAPEAKPIPTFADAAKVVIATQQKKSTNEKVRYQWAYLLGPAYTSSIADRRIDQIKTLDIKEILEPLLHTKPETARKLHRKIRKVGEYCRILLRDRHNIIISNFADTSDLRAADLEPPRQLSRGHHASLDWRRLPEFMKALREREAPASRLLEFTILTAIRTDAALKCKFSDIDLETKVWSVPIENLKDKKHRKAAFRVPLSDRAVAIVKEMAETRVSDYVFPGSCEDMPLSNMSMLTLLKRMRSGEEKWQDEDGRPITIHGFRASFKTWGRETRQDHDLVEEALGHVIGGKVERAYDRTDVLDLRREVMNAWAEACK